MRIGLFLGAGASVPFGMPTTSELRNKLQKFTYDDIEEEILHSFLLERKYPDIEHVLQAVRDIIKFSRSKGGAYFFAHGKNGIFRFNKGTVPFDTFVGKVVQAESTLEEFVYENYRWKPASREQVVKIYDEIISFLQRNSESVRIFTTNYDRIIEEYCHDKENYKCIDGFERNPLHSEISKWTGNFDIPNNSNNVENVFLYKLHGSLNWKEHVTHGTVKTNEESQSLDSNFTRNLVVMPTLSPKAEEEVEPFNTIISNFLHYMNRLDACLVIGFSFRDQLINKIFKSFVKKGKTLVVISPSSMKNVCTNLFGIEVPKNYDEKKISSLAPIEGNVWCIPNKLEPRNISNDLDVALAHFVAGVKK